MKPGIDKGHELERQIGEFFALSGYAVRRNVISEGRSGGKHELDVLAEKADGITTYRLVVECKAWDAPIEKDVVAKLDYVIRDLGLNKGIIVALAGWRTGAERAATQLGIDLWGPAELEARLGQVALAGLQAGPVALRAVGFPVVVSEEEAHRAITAQSRGRLGLGKEEVMGTKLVWVPFFLFQIACSRPDKQLFRKAALKTRTIWNAYEALQGSLHASWEAAPPLDEVAMTVALRPRVKPTTITGQLQKTLAKWTEVVRPATQERYATMLAALGIPLPTSSISIDSQRELYIPFHLGRLRSRGAERLVAVDAVTGRVDEGLGKVLTAHLSYVLGSVRQVEGPTTLTSRAPSPGPATG